MSVVSAMKPMCLLLLYFSSMPKGPGATMPVRQHISYKQKSIILGQT